MVLCAGELYVNLLMKGGPAHLSMQVQQGDRLRSVDGRPAGSMDLDVLQVRVQCAMPLMPTVNFNKEEWSRFHQASDTAMT
jgi:hypothetical protein